MPPLTRESLLTLVSIATGDAVDRLDIGSTAYRVATAGSNVAGALTPGSLEIGVTQLLRH